MEHIEDSTKNSPELSRALKWSLIVHVVAVVALIFQSLLFPGKPNPLKVLPTLRVDVVGLPDLLKKDMPQSAPPPSADQLSEKLKSAARDAKEVKEPVRKAPPVPAPKAPVEKAEPDEMVLKPKAVQSKDRERKLKSALDRIRSLEKISKDVESASPSKSKAAKPGILIKGNAISKGTSLSGEARESAVASYYDSLRDRISDNWLLPVWLQRQSLSAKVQLFIDARGHIRSFTFVQSSGNAQFDAEVKRALNDSQPFPVPPEGIAASLASNGILVGFPL